jgi:putative ABC transport system ATP-binding protein
MDNTLTIKNVSKRFNNIEVLKNISCELNPGDFVIMMGANGTGKSTLFEMIAGKILPDEGTIYLNGSDITQTPERKRASFIGRLHQNTFLGSCSNLTIRENLAMAQLKGQMAGLALGIRRFPEDIVEELLKPLNLNLEKLLDVPMAALSGGQRQIISFIMTILQPPQMLLLDEPTAALDPQSATSLLSFAQSFASRHQIPTLLITHDPLVARHLGNRLWILQEGRIQREYRSEKSTMNPLDFFHAIDYAKFSNKINNGSG